MQQNIQIIITRFSRENLNMRLKTMMSDTKAHYQHANVLSNEGLMSYIPRLHEIKRWTWYFVPTFTVPDTPITCDLKLGIKYNSKNVSYYVFTQPKTWKLLHKNIFHPQSYCKSRTIKSLSTNFNLKIKKLHLIYQPTKNVMIKTITKVNHSQQT